MLRQHRTHVYMFYISGWWARVFRWDRNGALVTHPIDLRTNSKQFLNLIYRLVLAHPRIQGFDNTVSLASNMEIEKFRLHEPNNMYLEEYKKTVLASVLEHPIYKVCSFPILNSSVLTQPRRWSVTKSCSLMIIGGCVHRDGSGSSSVNMLREDTPQ